MDQFEKFLAQQLSKPVIPEMPIPIVETVTLIRIFKFYDFIKSKGWSGSICLYKGDFSAWINAGELGIYDGLGETIGQALDDVIKQFSKPRG